MYRRFDKLKNYGYFRFKCVYIPKLCNIFNEAKEKLLGVSSDSVKEKGVVSEEVSLEMINGLLNNYDCDIALSTTGIAGPSGGTGEKPVGLVYISVGNKKIQKTFKFVENKNLNRILMKYSFTSKALEILLNFLNENY